MVVVNVDGVVKSGGTIVVLAVDVNLVHLYQHLDHGVLVVPQGPHQRCLASDIDISTLFDGLSYPSYVTVHAESNQRWFHVKEGNHKSKSWGGLNS